MRITEYGVVPTLFLQSYNRKGLISHTYPLLLVSYSSLNQEGEA